MHINTHNDEKTPVKTNESEHKFKPTSFIVFLPNKNKKQ